jgi:hypothetical protein
MSELTIDFLIGLISMVFGIGVGVVIGIGIAIRHSSPGIRIDRSFLPPPPTPPPPRQDYGERLREIGPPPPPPHEREALSHWRGYP